MYISLHILVKVNTNEYNIFQNFIYLQFIIMFLLYYIHYKIIFTYIIIINKLRLLLG